jgi:LacI family transcriptional regulator
MKTSRRTTISDVAKLASVGKVTVSYVLNGRGREAGISVETAERIQAAARELNYRPNGVARMLARSRADSIAIVFQHAHFFASASTFLNEVLRGVCEESAQLGLDVTLHTKPNADAVAEANAFSDGRTDGVLMLRDEGDATLAALNALGFPVVLFFSRSSDPEIPFVDCDNFSGGKIAAAHLLSLGHNRIGMVAGSPHSVDSSDRLQGFKSSVECGGYELSHLIRMPNPMAGSGELANALQSKHRPTALFVWSDDVAFECIRIIRDLGLSIPRDISIIGFDSTGACDRVDPPLTSIRQPIIEMARKATQILHSVVNGNSDESLQLVFPPRLDFRSSTSNPLSEKLL